MSWVLGAIARLLLLRLVLWDFDATTRLLRGRRIVFTSLEKFDGASYRPLTAAEVKQIAGRAGRFGSSHASGRVTCMHQVSTLCRCHDAQTSHVKD